MIKKNAILIRLLALLLCLALPGLAGCAAPDQATPTPGGGEATSEATDAAGEGESTPEATGDPSPSKPLPQGMQVLATPLYPVYDKEGNAYTVEDFSGKVLIMTFWTTWCPYCIDEMEYFGAALEKYGADNLAVVSVDLPAMEQFPSREDLYAEVEELTAGKNFELVYDSDSLWTSNLVGSGVPKNLIVGPDGVTRYYVGGAFPSQDTLFGLLDEVFAYYGE